MVLCKYHIPDGKVRTWCLSYKSQLYVGEAVAHHLCCLLRSLPVNRSLNTLNQPAMWEHCISLQEFQKRSLSSSSLLLCIELSVQFLSADNSTIAEETLLTWRIHYWTTSTDWGYVIYFVGLHKVIHRTEDKFWNRKGIIWILHKYFICHSTALYHCNNSLHTVAGLNWLHHPAGCSEKCCWSKVFTTLSGPE